MKTILITVMMTSFFACNGGGGGGGSSSVKLDSRLSEGTGQWKLNYTDSGSNFGETLTFTGVHVQYLKEFYPALSTAVTVFDKSIVLKSGSYSFASGANVADSSEVFTWTYGISGTTLTMCDETNYCVDFEKIP